MQEATEVSADVKDKISEYMKILDTLVEQDTWMAGENETLADFSTLANISQIKACGYNLSQHLNLQRWFDQCRQLAGFDENQRGADEAGNYFKNLIPDGFEQ